MGWHKNGIQNFQIRQPISSLFFPYSKVAEGNDSCKEKYCHSKGTCIHEQKNHICVITIWVFNSHFYTHLSFHPSVFCSFPWFPPRFLVPRGPLGGGISSKLRTFSAEPSTDGVWTLGPALPVPLKTLAAQSAARFARKEGAENFTKTASNGADLLKENAHTHFPTSIPEIWIFSSEFI